MEEYHKTRKEFIAHEKRREYITGEIKGARI